MAITFVNYKKSSGVALTVKVERPEDVLADDVLLAFIVGCAAAAVPVITPPAGWTPVESDSTNDGPVCIKHSVYMRIATASDAADWTWTFDIATNSTGSIVAYRGVDTADPVIAHDSDVTLNSLNIDCIGVIVSPAQDAFEVYGYGSTETVATVTLPALMTGRVDASVANACLVVADRTLPVSEYSDTNVATILTAEDNIGLSVVLRPLALVPWVAEDNYKSKVLRLSMPPPYDARWVSNLGKLLVVVGTSDNEIGGLYGDADYLPDQEP